MERRQRVARNRSQWAVGPAGRRVGRVPVVVVEDRQTGEVVQNRFVEQRVKIGSNPGGATARITGEPRRRLARSVRQHDS